MHFGGGPRRHGCSRRHRSPPPFAAFFAPDIEDWGAEYRIVTQVRGLTGDDIKLEIRGSELGVRAESGEEDSQISFKVQIPVDVAREFIMAEVNSNELTIVLPKAEPRVVTVETVDDPPQPQEQMEAEAEDVEPERRPPVVVDLNDWGSEYRLTQFAQGLTLDDINVQVRDGRLSVAIGELEVECLVPPGVVVDGIHADMDQSGILTVVLPKSEGRFIPVSVVGAAPAAPSAPPTDEGQSGMADVVRRTDVITLSDTEGDANDGGDGNDAPMAEFDENDGWVDVDGVPPKV
ncbi:hypothetical protein BSKO_06549 [Bryopsis sp. KO-2023]|nr:hypothetical protein BSKO_06549 [Bryopsis sp. KO-2023]